MDICIGAKRSNETPTTFMYGRRRKVAKTSTNDPKIVDMNMNNYATTSKIRR